ncbi:MAG: NAD(P)H-hydrate dehydratase [Armatimonadetes bacterium]|nr:NAD(P)H-hydrate dehydratase [Armatimonadota bacterium]
MQVVTGAEMGELDRRAEEEFGLPRALLMENAGRRVAEVVHTIVAPAGRRCAVLAGKGSNGGDGLVAARHLAARGWRAEVLLLAREDEVRGEPRRNLSLAREAGVEVTPVTSMALAAARERLSGADVIIDAIFGTGITGAPIGLVAQVIEAANAASAPVVAVDLPSGVDADTGGVRGAAVRATATVTMGLPKVGLLLYPGAAHAGRVYVAEIGYPPALLERFRAGAAAVTPQMVRAALPPRPADSHKGTYGRVLICAGSVGFTGAPSLCALGALRAGAGLVALAVGESIYPIVAGREVEAMPHPLPDADGALTEAAWDRLGELAAEADVVAVGPGLSARPGVAALIRRLLAESRAPLVLDADALNVLGGKDEALARSAVPKILTPHPGEMGRLLGRGTEEVQRDRLGAAREAAVRFGAVVVLKGARTVVAAPEGAALIVPAGNPGMATGGMGDVLTGVIAAFVAQRVPPPAAAWMGAYLHALAGDLVAERMGAAGLLAREVADAVPRARLAVLTEPLSGPIQMLP